MRPSPPLTLRLFFLQVPELQDMKRQLNAVKSLLSDKDIVAWHGHTCATSRAGLVVASVKRQIRPEMGTQVKPQILVLYFSP